MGLVPLSIKRPHPDHKVVEKTTGLSLLRDNFSVSSWLLIGAVFQCVLTLLLPITYAVLPAISLLSWRFIRTMLMVKGYIPNQQMEGVIPGKFSAQVPSRNGVLHNQASQEEVTVILLGARTNHPLGIFGPGYNDLGNYMNKMLADLADHAEEYGYLGQSSWVEANARQTNNQILTTCYFRSLEELHKYAHSPLHRRAWDWWNSITKTHPHLSIMHEVYQSPKGHWENIYINSHLNGIAAMRAPVQLPEEGIRPLINASRGSLRTQTGRMSRSDGADNEKYGAEPY